MGDAKVWIFTQRSGLADDFGRSRAPSGRQALAQASRLSRCSSAASPCDIARDRFGASSCVRCEARWSVTHSGSVVLAARARSPIGVDAEVPRSRPAAFRLLARVTGASIVSIEQWTQAEAIWKAAGQAHRRPLAGELVLPDAYGNGWNATADSAWNVFTHREPSLAWSVAVPRGAVAELEVHDLRDGAKPVRCPAG